MTLKFWPSQFGSCFFYFFITYEIVFHTLEISMKDSYLNKCKIFSFNVLLIVYKSYFYTLVLTDPYIMATTVYIHQQNIRSSSMRYIAIIIF